LAPLSQFNLLAGTFNLIAPLVVMAVVRAGTKPARVGSRSFCGWIRRFSFAFFLLKRKNYVVIRGILEIQGYSKLNLLL
jgi:hypothetical protein